MKGVLVAIALTVTSAVAAADDTPTVTAALDHLELDVVYQVDPAPVGARLLSARLQLRVDYPISNDVTIAPEIGGGIDRFQGEIPDIANGFDEAAETQVSFVGFAGLAGRFDLGL